MTAMDEELQTLLAAYERTLDPGDAAAYLTAALRSGRATEGEIEQAAWLGDRAAQLVLGSSNPSPPNEVGAWARGLARFGAPVVHRAALAVAAHVLWSVDDLEPKLRDACVSALAAARAHATGGDPADALLEAMELLRSGRPDHLSSRATFAYWCVFHACDALLLGGGRASSSVARQVFTSAAGLLPLERIVKVVRDDLLGDRWPLPRSSDEAPPGTG